MTSGIDEIFSTSELIHQYPCPFLGTPDDPKSVLGYPSAGNRCFAFRNADLVEREKQIEHCLSDNFSGCPIFRQGMNASMEDEHAPAKNNRASERVGSYARILQGRTLALGITSILILLAALIWLPLLALTIRDRTVLGASFNQKSQDAQFEDKESAVQNIVSQTIDVREQRIPATSTGEVNQSIDSSLDLGDSAATEIVDVSKQTAVSDQSGIEAYAEKSESKIEASLQIAISDLPDLYQVFQTQQEGDGNNTKPISNFSPIAYSVQGVVVPLISDDENNGESLAVYQVLGVENDKIIKLSRFEPVNVLGCNDIGDWLKIRTESGIEGWIRVTDIEPGEWAETLSELENDSGAGEVLSAPTSLSAIKVAAARHNSLMVRSAPGAKFKPITFLNKGETFGLLGRWQDGPWVRIRLHDGIEGWVKVDSLIPADK